MRAFEMLQPLFRLFNLYWFIEAALGAVGIRYSKHSSIALPDYSAFYIRTGDTLLFHVFVQTLENMIATG